MKHVIVVGGGAAGMMAAIAAASSGARVTLIEKNEKLGKKIYITGKGRCNVTNTCETSEFFSHVVSSGKFLYSAIYGFDSSMVMELIEDFGTKLKVERGGRVFPQSDHASDITAALHRAMQHFHVKVLLQTAVKEIFVETTLVAAKRVKGVFLTSGETMEADAVILATGGLSYPSTGSTGDGHKMLQALGFTLTAMRPSLVDLLILEKELLCLSGLSLRNVTLTIGEGKRPLYEGFGEMLFTHRGISGPLVLSASAVVGKHLEARPLPAWIDLKPALSKETLDKKLLSMIEENAKKEYHNFYKGLLPGKLMDTMVARSQISPDLKCGQITRQMREDIVNLLKAFPVTITATGGYKEAVITQGGLSTKEVNPSTMELKGCKGLFVAGELLDVDALTGGYNLQIAFSTGHLAGESAAGKE